MWKIIIIFIIIFAVVRIIKKHKQEKEYEEVYIHDKNPVSFGEQVQSIADQILRDAHSGCAIGGCCVYDLSETDDDDNWDDIDDDDDEKVCYCKYYEDYVPRKSPCEHFQDRKPRR